MADSGSSGDESTRALYSDSEQPAGKPDVVQQRTTAYHRVDETPRGSQQPSSQRRDDRDYDDDKPKSEARVLSRTPRDSGDIRRLQSQLPDRSDGSGTVKPG